MNLNNIDNLETPKKTDKPGYLTTEFWATVIGSALVAAASEYNIGLDHDTIVSITSMIITYTISRTTRKIYKGKS